MRQSRNIRCDLDASGIEKVSLSNMSLYPKYCVYKILLEISGLKKSVVISDLSLKPLSLNPKFNVLASVIAKMLLPIVLLLLPTIFCCC